MSEKATRRYGPVGGGSLQVGIPAGGSSEQVSPGGQTPARAVACDSIPCVSVEPTVFVDHDKMRIFQEEIFEPQRARGLF